MNKNKNLEYLKNIREKQIKKYFSKENIEKRKQKAIQYKNNIKQKQKEKGGLKKFSNKMINKHEKDIMFYQKIWNKRQHYCENCGKWLGDNFKDLNGNVIIYRYAHIIPKAIYPYLRHYEDNILLLCLNCHTNFDNLPQDIVQTMNCYDEKIIQKLKELHKVLKEQNNIIYQ